MANTKEGMLVLIRPGGKILVDYREFLKKLKPGMIEHDQFSDTNLYYGVCRHCGKSVTRCGLVKQLVCETQGCEGSLIDVSRIPWRAVSDDDKC